jgi:arylformamidase
LVVRTRYPAGVGLIQSNKERKELKGGKIFINKIMEDIQIDYRTLGNLAQCIDISWPITETTTTHNDNHKTVFTAENDVEKDGNRSTSIRIHSQTGTHVKNGNTIEQTPLRDLMGMAKVIDFSVVESVNKSGRITKEDFLALQSSLDNLEGQIVLLKTRNSYKYLSDAKWQQNFVYLDASGADYLVNEKKVKAVGIDYIHIERIDIQTAHETYEILHQNHVPIIEGLRLAHAQGIPVTESTSPIDMHQGIYYLICLPIRLVGIESAPARAILIPLDFRM